jgi:hypothetical protein
MASILAANALTTLATMQAELRTTAVADENPIERLINVASDAIEKYCGRGFYKLETTERVFCNGDRRVILQRTPITSTAAEMVVTNDGSAITSHEVEDATLGFLWLDSGWPAADLVAEGVSCEPIPGSAQRVLTVKYTGGYVTPSGTGTRNLPYDLEQACIDTVASLWRRRGVDRAAPTFDAQNDAIGRASGGIIPGAVLPTLNRYRRGC